MIAARRPLRFSLREPGRPVRLLTAVVICACACASAVVGASRAQAAERPLIGDVTHGRSLLDKAGHKKRVDGAWLNRFSDEACVDKLGKGSDDLPRIDSDNPLDRWDALAALRADNSDIRDLLMGGDTVLTAETKLDEHALTRLKEQAKIGGSIDEERTVFAVFKLGEAAGAGPRPIYVAHKDSKKRDKLKKETKVGYVVFLAIPGFRGGQYEAAIAIDKDIRVEDVVIRAPDGSAPTDLNQAAQRFKGKGARGQYAELKAGGAGKAIGEIARPLSDAFLLAAESVYMWEVQEKDYFAFGG